MIVSRFKCRSLSILITALLFWGTAYCVANPVRIAVASNFQQPLHEIATVYEAKQNDKLSISVASSGKLYAQIIHGAPFDIFLSADEDKIDRLIQSGHIPMKDSLLYSQGQIALFTTKNALLPIRIHSLRQPNLRIAIANPKLAPYGLAAQNVIHQLIPDFPEPLIIGENIAQTFHFTNSGNADVGLVAYSQLIKTQPRERYTLIPNNLYEPILQKAGVLKASKNPEAARRFLHFLQTDEAEAIMATYGYLKP